MIESLIRRMKLLFRKDKELYASLRAILGVTPRDIELFRVALTHKSVGVKVTINGRTTNNERLEFLGDAILEAVVSDIVFHKFSNSHEGFLSTLRAKIVCRENLNRLSEQIGLDKLIIRRDNQQQPRHNHIGGNAFEALVGALYLDQGFAACQKFIANEIIAKHFNLDNEAERENNYKSIVLEWTQKNKLRLFYDTKEAGRTKGGTQLFRSLLTIEGVEAGIGEGKSKKESEQRAALNALCRLNESEEFVERFFATKAERIKMEVNMIAAVPHLSDEQKRQGRARSGGSKIDHSSSPAPVTQQKIQTGTAAESEGNEWRPYSEELPFNLDVDEEAYRHPVAHEAPKRQATNTPNPPVKPKNEKVETSGKEIETTKEKLSAPHHKQFAASLPAGNQEEKSELEKPRTKKATMPEQSPNSLPASEQEEPHSADDLKKSPQKSSRKSEKTDNAPTSSGQEEKETKPAKRTRKKSAQKAKNSSEVSNETNERENGVSLGSSERKGRKTRKEKSQPKAIDVSDDEASAPELANTPSRPKRGRKRKSPEPGVGTLFPETESETSKNAPAQPQEREGDSTLESLQAIPAEKPSAPNSESKETYTLAEPVSDKERFVEKADVPSDSSMPQLPEVNPTPNTEQE